MLWLYNLHYFNDLNSSGNIENIEFHKSLLKNWIENNKNINDVGWDPYPLSIRIVNFIKIALTGHKFENFVYDSFYSQSIALFAKLEKDILANHYFSNLKALFFAGNFYGNDEWTAFATKELLIQIDEQVNEDGSNFELSPMYHGLFVIDLLEILNLCQSIKNNQYPELIKKCKKIIPKMLNFLDAMSFADDDISFFNDSLTVFCQIYQSSSFMLKN